MEQIKRAFAKFATFLTESWQEVRWKVTWPSRKEVWGTTLVVLVTVLLFAVFLGALDVTLKFLVVDKLFSYFA